MPRKAMSEQNDRFLDLHGIKVVSWDVDGILYAMPQLVRAMYGLYAKRLIDPQFVQNHREVTKLWLYRRRMARVRNAGGEIDAEAEQVIMAKDIAAEQRSRPRKSPRLAAF